MGGPPPIREKLIQFLTPSLTGCQTYTTSQHMGSQVVALTERQWIRTIQAFSFVYGKRFNVKNPQI